VPVALQAKAIVIRNLFFFFPLILCVASPRSGVLNGLMPNSSRLNLSLSL
jgi:hypothetical protein